MVNRRTRAYARTCSNPEMFTLRAATAPQVCFFSLIRCLGLFAFVYSRFYETRGMYSYVSDIVREIVLLLKFEILFREFTSLFY